MSDIKTKYGTSNQAITVSIASLANNGARQSDVVDNTTLLFLDALVSLKVKSPASSTDAAGYINVYAYGTVDGTTYSDSASGSDAAFTPTSPPNLKLIGVANVNVNATTYRIGPFSVAGAFGGILPAKWGIVVENKTGGTLDSTEGNHDKRYQGVLAQAV